MYNNKLLILILKKRRYVIWIQKVRFSRKLDNSLRFVLGCKRLKRFHCVFQGFVEGCILRFTDVVWLYDISYARFFQLLQMLRRGKESQVTCAYS